MAKVEELEAQLKLAKKDIETLSAMAGSTAKEAASEMKDAASAQLDKLSDDARQVYLDAIKEGRKASQAAEAQIKANPFTATGIAFLLGLAVAAIFNRR